MADKRLTVLTERATPVSGDYTVVDNTALAEARKFDLTKPLLKSAGSGQAVTDTLYLDPALAVDSNDAATVLKLPVLTDDGSDFNFTIASVDFGGIKDTTFNWGFNNGAAGPSVASKHAWYLQLEYDYFTGAHYAEYHLNLFGADAAFAFRPFEYKYNLSGASGSIIHRASTLQYLSLGAVPHTVLSVTIADTDAASNFYIKAPFRIDIPADNANGVYLLSKKSDVLILQIDTTNNDIYFKGRVISFQNASGTQILYKGVDDVFRVGGGSYNGAMLNILQKTNGRGLAINLAATTPGVFAYRSHFES